MNKAILTVISIHFTLFVILVIWIEWEKYKNRNENE